MKASFSAILLLLGAMPVHASDAAARLINELAILQAADAKQPGHVQTLQSLFDLADQASHADFWSLGGGRGPTTPDSLRMSILAVVDVSKLTPEVLSHLTGWHAEHLRALAQSSSVSDYRRALTNKNPVIRWMALKLLRQPAMIHDLVPELESLVSTDPWFQLSFELTQSMPGVTPPPPGSGAVHVTAPLRSMAHHILKTAAIESTYEKEIEEMERIALQSLCETGTAKPDEKQIIVDAIFRLDFRSQAGLLMKQSMEETQGLEAQFEKLKAFVNQKQR